MQLLPASELIAINELYKIAQMFCWLQNHIVWLCTELH